MRSIKTQNNMNPQNEQAQYIKELVNKYLKDNYSLDDRIDCRFDIIGVDIHRDGKITQNYGIVYFTKSEYTQLLSLMLNHPNLTFQDLPLHIPQPLYDKIVMQLRFPTYDIRLHLTDTPRRQKPVAVEMKTLQEDLWKIAGEEAYSFILPPEANAEFQELYGQMWLHKMTLSVCHIVGENLVKETYSQIDTAQLKHLLGVNTYPKIHEALLKIYSSLPNEQQNNICWLFDWLKAQPLKYSYYRETVL